MDAVAMRPGDGAGGEGSADAPAASGIGVDNLPPPYSGYFSLLLSQVDMARTVRPDDCGATAASVQADFDDLINPSSRLELADIWGTHHSVNQTANHGLDSQMEIDSNGYME